MISRPIVQSLHISCRTNRVFIRIANQGIPYIARATITVADHIQQRRRAFLFNQKLNQHLHFLFFMIQSKSGRRLNIVNKIKTGQTSGLRLCLTLPRHEGNTACCCCGVILTLTPLMNDLLEGILLLSRTLMVLDLWPEEVSSILYSSFSRSLHSASRVYSDDGRAVGHVSALAGIPLCADSRNQLSYNESLQHLWY